MSLTQPMLKSSLLAMNDLARTANLKLRKEASLPQHRLRFLVCHANMLDAISLSLEEIQLRQIQHVENLITCERSNLSCNSTSANVDIHQVTYDSETVLNRKGDSCLDDGHEQQTIAISLSSSTSEIISQVGYDLERTISRTIDTRTEFNCEAAPSLINMGDEQCKNTIITAPEDLKPSQREAFQNPVVMGLC